MMGKYDAVWILSSNHPDVNVLTDINVGRLEKGVEIYSSKKAGNIAISGGSSGEMLNYLVSLGIPREMIHLEELSRETVANVILFELMIRRLKNWSNVALVSSEAHLKRTNAIINKLYPENFKLDSFGVSSNGENSKAFEERERFSLADFERDFKGIKPGDDIEIISRLLDVHEEYKNRSDKEKLRAMLMRYL